MIRNLTRYCCQQSIHAVLLKWSPQQNPLEFFKYAMSDQCGAIKAHAMAGKTTTETLNLILAVFGEMALFC